MRDIDGKYMVSSLKEIVGAGNDPLFERLQGAKKELHAAEMEHAVLEEQSQVLGLAMERSGLEVEKGRSQEPDKGLEDDGDLSLGM